MSHARKALIDSFGDTWAWCGDYLLPFLYLVLFVSLFACCVAPNAADAGTRAALNMLTDTVGPASKLARQSCDARQALIPKQVAVDPNLTAAQGKEKLIEVRTRCDALKTAFDTIRRLQEEAAQYVESGSLAQAQHKLDEARQQFRSLAPLLEDP